MNDKYWNEILKELDKDITDIIKRHLLSDNDIPKCDNEENKPKEV